jgi:predicted nucleic acid-binding protein
MIIVDTNLLAYLYLVGERSSQADAAFQKDPDWIAPLLWRSEFRSVLSLYIRKNLISIDQAYQMMNEAQLLMKGREYEVASLPVLKLIASSTCSAYDLEFVALAQDLALPLVTTDRKVLEQFPETAISLDKFIENEQR